MSSYLTVDVERVSVELTLEKYSNQKTLQLKCALISSDFTSSPFAYLTPNGLIRTRVHLDNPVLPEQGGDYKCVAYSSETLQYIYSNSLHINDSKYCFYIYELSTLTLQKGKTTDNYCLKNL